MPHYNIHTIAIQEDIYRVLSLKQHLNNIEFESVEFISMLSMKRKRPFLNSPSSYQK